jgi:hypothetical protein
MIVPKQLANTMEFILERAMFSIGAAAEIVIGPPAYTNPETSGRYYRSGCKRHAGLFTCLTVSKQDNSAF